MKWKLAALGAVLCWACAAADDVDSRAKISGEWQLQSGSGKASGESWILDGKDDAIRVTQFQSGRKLAEFDCNTLGRDCEAKDSNRRVKVSFWFNGPKLVQLETRGTDVVKRRFSVVEQGDEMEVEVIPIFPAGKPVVTRFKRVQVAAARQ